MKHKSRFQDWLENKNLKPRSIKNYLYYFGKFHSDIFDQATVSKFLSYKNHQNTIARSFILNYKTFLLSNYREMGLSEEERILCSEIELPKLSGRTRQRIIHPIPHHQIELLERALPSEKLKIQLLISYYCALRMGEMLKIRLTDFNWEEWGTDTSKMGECRVFGKGDKEGIALVPSFLMKRIGIYIKNNKFSSINSWLFLKSGEDIDLEKLENKGRIWQKRLREAGIKIGITKFDLDNRPIKSTSVHPHRLRHSYATYLLTEKNMTDLEIKEVLRHSSVQSTQIYAHVNKEKLKEKLSS